MDDEDLEDEDFGEEEEIEEIDDDVDEDLDDEDLSEEEEKIEDLEEVIDDACIEQHHLFCSTGEQRPGLLRIPFFNAHSIISKHVSPARHVMLEVEEDTEDFDWGEALEFFELFATTDEPPPPVLPPVLPPVPPDELPPFEELPFDDPP